MPKPSSRFLGLAAAALVLGASLTAAAQDADAPALDAYGDAFARAAAFEQQGNLDEAARVLELVVPLYPQDIALLLQIAWIHRRAGRPLEAERFYRAALARSPGAVDARLGLSLVLEATARCDEARPILEGLQRELPDLALAEAALARCAPVPSSTITPEVALSGTLFPNHPYKSMAGGVAAGLLFAHRSGFFLDGMYRYTHFVPATGAMLSPWDQHEGYFSTGYSVPLGGIGFHYAAVYDGSGLFGLTHHAGISTRWSPFGDIEVRGSVSFYPDMLVLRVEPSWRIPIAGGLSIRPGAGLADAGGAFLPTAMGTLALDRSRFSLWAGGKYGDEVRPVYLQVPVVYDITERIPYGAWGGASVNVSDDVRIHVSYAMDRLQQPDGTGSFSHTLSVGAAATF
jgi:hypothetical protein